VPLEEQPRELQSMLGYEFFKIDPSTGRVREFNEIFGPEAQQDFWLKLDDLVHDMCGLLKMLESDVPFPDSPADRGAVYLAVTTTDLRDEREAIKRDLEQHGHTVLPDRPLPLAVSELEAAVREYLSRCRQSGSGRRSEIAARNPERADHRARRVRIAATARVDSTGSGGAGRAPTCSSERAAQ